MNYAKNMLLNIKQLGSKGSNIKYSVEEDGSGSSVDHQGPTDLLLANI